MIPIPMKIYYNNQSTIFIASNPVFHERTKHIGVDCYFIRDLVITRLSLMFGLRISWVISSPNHLGAVHFLLYVAS